MNASGVPDWLERWFGRGRKRPNVVWICVDDFTPDVSGAYGSKKAQTLLSTPSNMAFLAGREQDMPPTDALVRRRRGSSSGGLADIGRRFG